MSLMYTTTASVIFVALCRLVIGITGLYWLISGDELGFFVALISVLLTMLPSRFTEVSLLQDATSVLIAVLLAAHIVLGMQMELYETSKLYDKAIHFLGSSAIGGVIIIAIGDYSRQHSLELPLPLFVLLVFGGTLSAGTLWEIFEFTIDRTGLFQAQRGLHDTMLDLLADTTGAVLTIAVMATIQWVRRRSDVAAGAAIQ